MAKQRTLTPDPATTQIEVPKPQTGTALNGESLPSPQPDGSAQTITAPATAPEDNPENLPAPRRGSLIGPRGVQFTTMGEMYQFARAAWASGMIPTGKGGFKNESGVFIALQLGAEVGLSPMQSIQNICVINDRPSIFGPALIALCRTKPDWIEASYSERVEGEGDRRRGIVTVQRTGGNLVTKEFSMADARRADLLGKDNWNKYPDDMLINRARARCLKSTFSHHLHGLGIAEEERDMEETRTIEATASPAYIGTSEPRGVRDSVGELADAMGVPTKPQAKPEPVKEQSWAAYFRKQLAEAVAAVDLEGMAKQIEDAHAAQRINVDEANALWAELDRRGKEFGANG